MLIAHYLTKEIGKTFQSTVQWRRWTSERTSDRLSGLRTRVYSFFSYCCDNDVKTQKFWYILQKCLEFKEAVWPSKVKFAGHMWCGDLDPVFVANNIF